MSTFETKHQKFVRLAENRTNKILETINLLGNLSNLNVYDYSESEINLIFSTIENQLKETKKKFILTAENKNKRFTLKQE